MMSLGEGPIPGAVAWVCIGVYSILDENINYIVDLVGTAKDANWRIADPKKHSIPFNRSEKPWSLGHD